MIPVRDEGEEEERNLPCQEEEECKEEEEEGGGGGRGKQRSLMELCALMPVIFIHNAQD